MKRPALAGLFAALLTLLWAQGALAASPILDPSGVANTSTASAVSTPFQATATVTTTDTNDAAVAVIMNQNQGATATVASVTGCGITWAKLKSQAQAITGHAGSGNLEVWSAPAPSALAGCTITVTLTASGDGVQISTFGINGLNSISSPLDANASAAVCTSASLSVPSAPAVSTTTANDLLIGAGFYAANGVVTANFTTSAWTLQYNYAFSGTVIDNQRAGSASKSVSTTQSGTAVDLTAAPVAPDAMILCGLAFAGPGVATPKSSSMPLLGVSDGVYRGEWPALIKTGWHGGGRGGPYVAPVGGACSGDGSAGAPAGSVPLFPNAGTGLIVPQCKVVDKDFGAGATGLGTPGISNAQTLTSSAVLHFAATPGYVANGLAAFDISNYPKCLPANTTVSSFDGTTVTLSANPSVTCPAGTSFGFLPTVSGYSPPAGVTVDTTNHLIRCGGTSPVIEKVYLYDYQIHGDSGCVSPTIQNVVITVGPSSKSPIILGSATVNCLVQNATLDGQGLTDSSSELFGMQGTGSCLLQYVRCVDAGTDCLDGTPASGSLTIDYELNSFINTGPSGGHGDLSQNWSTAAAITVTANRNAAYLTIPGLVTQGWDAGTGGSGAETLPNPTFTNNFAFTNSNQPNWWFIFDMSAVTGTATVSGNYVIPSGGGGAGLKLVEFVGSGSNTKSVTGNVDMNTGAALCQGTTVSC